MTGPSSKASTRSQCGAPKRTARLKSKRSGATGPAAATGNPPKADEDVIGQQIMAGSWLPFTDYRPLDHWSLVRLQLYFLEGWQHFPAQQLDRPHHVLVLDVAVASDQDQVTRIETLDGLGQLLRPRSQDCLPQSSRLPGVARRSSANRGRRRASCLAGWPPSTGKPGGSLCSLGPRIRWSPFHRKPFPISWAFSSVSATTARIWYPKCSGPRLEPDLVSGVDVYLLQFQGQVHQRPKVHVGIAAARCPDNALRAASAGEPYRGMGLLHRQHPRVDYPVVVVLALPSERARLRPALDNQVVGLLEPFAVLSGVKAGHQSLHRSSPHKP